MDASELNALLQRPIAFHRVFVTISGSVTAALMLSQAWYWSQTRTAQARDGWFWKTQEEWEQETGLTRHEQETARKRLIQRGFLEEDRRGVPARLFFRLNVDEIARTVTEASRQCHADVQSAVIPQSSLPHSGKLDCHNAASKNAGKSQSGSPHSGDLYTKNTAETTPENSSETRAGEVPLASGRSLSLTPASSTDVAEKKSPPWGPMDAALAMAGQKLFAYLRERIGPFSDVDAQIEAIRWMLGQGHTADECKGCLDHQLEQRGQQERISWLTVQNGIGIWLVKQKTKPQKTGKPSRKAG